MCVSPPLLPRARTRHGADAGDEFGQCIIRRTKIGAITVLEKDPTPHPMIDSAEVRRVNRQSALVWLARTSKNT